MRTAYPARGALPSSLATAFSRVNGDGALNITGAVAILECVFRGATSCSPDLCARDSNGYGRVDLSDPVDLLAHLFPGGAGLTACQ